MTISAADAVPGVHQHHHRDLGGDGQAGLGQVHLTGLRPTVGGDDRPVGDEDAGHVDGLVEQAAAVLAQIEDERAGALVQHLLDLAAHLVARAGSEARQLDVADLGPLVVEDPAGGDGHDEIGAAHGDDAPLRAAHHRQRHLGAGAPLDERRREVSRAVGQRGGADLDDHVTAGQARLLRRRALEDVLDEQALGLHLDVDPDPAQVRVVLVLKRAVVARVVIVRVLVVEARHRGRPGPC